MGHRRCSSRARRRCHRCVLPLVSVLVLIVVSGVSGRCVDSPADFDGDGIVGFDDFFLFADHFGATAEDNAWDSAYDLDGDPDIDFDDFFVFADAFGACVGD